MDEESTLGIFFRQDEESTRGMVIPSEITAHGHWFKLANSKCGKNPPNANNFRIINSKGSLLQSTTSFEI
jgi:hypothetical protein